MFILQTFLLHAEGMELIAEHRSELDSTHAEDRLAERHEQRERSEHEEEERREREGAEQQRQNQDSEHGNENFDHAYSKSSQDSKPHNRQLDQVVDVQGGPDEEQQLTVNLQKEFQDVQQQQAQKAANATDALADAFSSMVTKSPEKHLVLKDIDNIDEAVKSTVGKAKEVSNNAKIIDKKLQKKVAKRLGKGIKVGFRKVLKERSAETKHWVNKLTNYDKKTVKYERNMAEQEKRLAKKDEDEKNTFS